MRLTLLRKVRAPLFVLLLAMYTVPLRGADDPVGGRMLQEVLQAFSERYQVLFSFDADLVRGVEVNFEFRDEESFDDAINRLLSTTSLQYKSLGSKYYVIYRSDRQGHRTLRRLERKINQIQALEAGGQVSLQPTVQSMSRRAGLIGATALQMVGKRITGTVRDDEGNPLVGATVRVQGYNVGAITDEAGNFAIDAPDEATTLLVSYIGFDTQVIELAGRTAVEVVMQLSNNSLDEVVVIGFGSQKRQDLTGAIASVDGDILNEMPVSSMEQALAGRLAGVQVMSGSGVPGAGASIRVRGVGSLNNAEPLYVIDGIIIGNVAGGGQSAVSPLSLINPNDIERIDILKDASATAIYGARAGNGVVIITTKRGKEGTLNVTFDTYSAWNVLDQSNFQMLTGPEWAQFFDEVQAEAGNTDYPGKGFVDRVLAGENLPQYDWFDHAYRDGRINSYNLSLTAGSAKSRYFVSANYFDQTGLLPNSDLRRGTVRMNSDHQISRRLNIGANLAVSRSEANVFGNVDGNVNTKDWITRLVTDNPYKPIFDPADGDYAGRAAHDPDADEQLDYANTHTIWALDQEFDQDVRNRIWGSLSADWEIVKGLKFHTMGSLDWSFNKDERRSPANTIDGAMNVDPTSNRLGFGYGESRTWFIENTLTYARQLGKHDFSVMAGYQAQNNLNKGFSTSGGGFIDTDYWFYDRPQLTNEIVDADGNVLATIPLIMPGNSNFQNESAFVSAFGRIIYNYAGKYLLTATLRRDGSSRFGPDQRWGTFPAVSAGWRISEEAFMSGLSLVSNLKLRAGWGISGSDNTSLYQWNSRVGTGDEQNYVFNGGRVPGATLVRLANPFLAWEEIVMANVGIDLGLFNGRLELTADYFDKTTRGLLLPFAPAVELGALSNPSGNLGEISNRGFEAVLSTVNLLTRDFLWRTDVNVSVVRNRIVALPENADRFNGPNISRVGEEIGALYGFQSDGVFRNWDEVYDHAFQNQSVLSIDPVTGAATYSDKTDQATINNNTAPGDLRFVDQNSDGIIDADNDRVVVGSTIPDFTWGVNNTVMFKGISLSVLLQGVHGVQVYNQLRARQERFIGSWENKRNTVAERWTTDNPDSDMPRLTARDPNANQRFSDHWVENASFVRIKNLRLGYTIPASLLARTGWNTGGIELYAIGTNLLTFTEYSGFDPEVGLRNGSDPETAGVDAGLYPLSRQYTLGFKVSF